MINPMSLMHDQEVRRQAMLQAMQLEVWLPRQQLVNAAASREYLLQWQPEDCVVVEPSAAAQSRAKVTATAAPSHNPVTRPRGEVYVSVHEKLAALQAAQPAKAAVKPMVAAVADPTPATPAVEATELAPAEPIPRFALQLLRADNCLVLVDLPTGEPFQSRDPDYQLLKDMLRAAGLTDKPSFMRQGTPITWPLLLTGNLMHEQNATAARACVRDLLSVELQSAPTACIWLLGKQAVRFANAIDEAPLYSLQDFSGATQVWSLPGLEQVLEQPLLKRDIWRSMCAVCSLWQVENDG